MSESYDSEKNVEVSPNDDLQVSDLAKDDLKYSDLKLDKHGLPLVPQPSRFKDDPLVCNLMLDVGQYSPQE